MSATPCSRCSEPQAAFHCGLCGVAICKACREYVDPTIFSYFLKKPAELAKSDYCHGCYDAKVAPRRAEYEALLEKAEDIYFLTKNYPGYVRVLRRHTKRVVVPECADRRETILRMAFVAAELGFNAIIEADVESQKVRNGGFQSSVWKGSAMPALIDGDQLERSSLRRI